MNKTDKMIARWAAEKFGFPVEDYEGIEFETWIGCYSSWTCDYGVKAIIKRKSGTHHTTQWSFPEVIKQLQEFKDTEEALAYNHDESHGWE